MIHDYDDHDDDDYDPYSFFIDIPDLLILIYFFILPYYVVRELDIDAHGDHKACERLTYGIPKAASLPGTI